MRSHCLEIFFRVVRLYQELILPKCALTVNPVVTVALTWHQVITDETVQWVTTILVVVVVVQVIGVRLMIDRVGKLNQFIQVMDTICLKDRVGFHKGRKHELTFLGIIGRCLLARAVTGRRVYHAKALTTDSRVGVYCIGLVDILHQRVGHASQTKSLIEDAQLGILLYQGWQQVVAGLDDMVNDMNYAIGHRVVTLNQT